MVNNPNKIKEACTKENLESCLHQAKNFNPRIINGITVEDCISYFFVILQGLLDKNVLDDYKFLDGC